jgi:hypothetical protein
MDHARITQQHKTPVALFDLTPEQLADENLDATVEAVMAALAEVRATRSRRDPSAPDADPARGSMSADV